LSDFNLSLRRLDTPLLPSAVHGSPSPSCDVSRGAEAMQANVTSLQDAAVAVDDIRSAPERYSSAASSSQAQSDNQAVNMQSGKHRAVPNIAHLTEHFCLGEEATRQALPLTAAGTQNAKSHSLTVSGSAMVSSPTMNFNSPGATGASTKKSFFFSVLSHICIVSEHIFRYSTCSLPTAGSIHSKPTSGRAGV
jgi:hypothetical protein